MKPLIIKIADDTPAVIFYPKYKKFQIVGTSWPETASKFYEPVLNWIDQYFNNEPLDETVFEFYFKYFNTASFKEIVKLLDKLKSYSQKFKIKIKWFYEPDDIDMKRFGEQLKNYFNLDFSFGIKKNIKG